MNELNNHQFNFFRFFFLLLAEMTPPVEGSPGVDAGRTPKFKRCKITRQQLVVLMQHFGAPRPGGAPRPCRPLDQRSRL